jgi:hypothetical protein
MLVISLLWRTCCPQRQINLVYWGIQTLVHLHPSLSYYLRLMFFVQVLTEQVAGGIVVPGSGRLIACLGVDDLVIVDMPDTLLVTTRARSQEVKRLVKKTRDAGWAQLL